MSESSLSANVPAKISFYGIQAAELFSRGKIWRSIWSTKRTIDGFVRADFHFDEGDAGRWTLRISVAEGTAIPRLTLRFPDGSRVERQNVTGCCAMPQPPAM